MVNFSSIDKLERDREQGGLYDLYVTYFTNNKRIIVYGYKVQRGESMRIDNICNKIYKNLNHLTFLMDLNNILNPLTIKDGDLIFYVNEDDIPSFKAPAEEGAKIRDKVINKAISDKKQQIDKARQDYVKKRKQVDALPPNIKQTSSQAISVDNGVVKIILDKDQSLRAKNRR